MIPTILQPRLILSFMAIVYVGLGLWCLIDPVGTASGLGFAFVSPNAESEWRTVYGGMEIGVGVWAGWAALAPRRWAGASAGLSFFHGGLVVVRLPTVVFIPGLGMGVLILAAAELLLLALALIAWRRSSLQMTHSGAEGELPGTVLGSKGPVGSRAAGP